MRGSRAPCVRHGAQRGSIPADAGEPPTHLHPPPATRVDPRGCGGASEKFFQYVGLMGRSPRMRGSLEVMLWAHSFKGSIPADAGEPPSSDPARAAGRVDPRGCGGALTTATPSTVHAGRSPRMRGSLNPQRAHLVQVGSIPADAGEPSSLSATGNVSRVDPRGCGGAIIDGCLLMCREGRSPRMRGSPLIGHRVLQRLGSIPADAGEPPWSTWR